MRNRFDEQLELLNVELIRMGALCEDAISFASRTLMGEAGMAGLVCAADKEIDQKEREIEALCMRILLQQQPVAGDLRTVSSALKMISDMERIGDQASDIAEICGYIQGKEAKSRIHIRDMAEATMEMVTRSIDSFVKKDLAIARWVVRHDDVVDDLFQKVRQELIGILSGGKPGYGAEDGSGGGSGAEPEYRPEQEENPGEFCIDMLMIAKYFERIGDHAVNIAQWVEFSITGVHEE